jgi:hypothetical protein
MNFLGLVKSLMQFIIDKCKRRFAYTKFALKNLNGTKLIVYVLSILSLLILFLPLFIKIPHGIKSGGFGDYLGLITGLAGAIVTITVFLIQNTTQEYSSQLLRLTFFRKKHFAFILTYILLALLYFAYGISFNINQTQAFFGLILSFGLVLNFTSLLILSSYHMNILNTIKEVESNIIKYILLHARPHKLWIIGNVSLNDKSQNEIVGMINPLFQTLSKSIISNQNDVSSQCLSSLDKIVKTYLVETQNYKVLDDKILTEVSDRCAFIMEIMINSSNQKFMDKFPLFVSNVGKYTLQFRYNIAGVNNHALTYSSLLVKIFIHCYKYDYTVAPKKSIEGISSFVEICIEKGYYQSASIYYYDLNKIRKLCIANPNDWSRNLLVLIIFHQKKIINHSVNLVRENKNIELHFYRRLFEDIYEIICESYDKFSNSNYRIINASLFGLYSILTVITKKDTVLPFNIILPNSIERPTLENYSNLCINIMRNRNLELESTFANFLPEFLFVTHFIQKKNESFSEQHANLLLNLLQRIEYEASKSSTWHIEERLFSAVEDYFAILIYLGSSKLLNSQLDILISFYDKIKISPNVERREKRDFYYLLKNIGAFMEGQKDLISLQSKIIKTILVDFKRPASFEGKAFPSFFQQYDYHTFNHSWDDWHIYPLSIWNVFFTSSMNDFINKESGMRFIDFQNKLVSKKFS